MSKTNCIINDRIINHRSQSSSWIERTPDMGRKTRDEPEENESREDRRKTSSKIWQCRRTEGKEEEEIINHSEWYFPKPNKTCSIFYFEFDNFQECKKNIYEHEFFYFTFGNLQWPWQTKWSKWWYLFIYSHIRTDH